MRNPLLVLTGMGVSGRGNNLWRGESYSELILRVAAETPAASVLKEWGPRALGEQRGAARLPNYGGSA